MELLAEAGATAAVAAGAELGIRGVRVLPLSDGEVFAAAYAAARSPEALSPRFSERPELVPRTLLSRGFELLAGLAFGTLAEGLGSAHKVARVPFATEAPFGDRLRVGEEALDDAAERNSRVRT